MAERPYFLEPSSIREDWRLGVAALFGAGDGVKASPGVLSGMTVAQTATASGGVLVTAGWCVNQATSATGGAYLECLDSQATVDVFGGRPPESSPRNDLIVYQSGATPKLQVIRGTASAVPSDPTIPAQACVLARIRVKAASAYGGSPAIVNADVDDLRQFTSLRGRAPLMQVFTTSGTWEKPPGCVGVRVQVQAGGGAGGGAVATASLRASVGGGGGAGGYAESTLDAADVPASVAVTVGAGGPPVAGGPGDPGGNSSFGALVSATGGIGGLVATPNNPGIGGAGGGQGGTGAGQHPAAGGGGAGGVVASLGATATTAVLSGAGGSSFFGGGGRSLHSHGAGINGSAGGGGGGAANGSGQGTARGGGQGGAGVVIVTAYF